MRDPGKLYGQSISTMPGLTQVTRISGEEGDCWRLPILCDWKVCQQYFCNLQMTKSFILKEHIVMAPGVSALVHCYWTVIERTMQH